MQLRQRLEFHTRYVILHEHYTSQRCSKRALREHERAHPIRSSCSREELVMYLGRRRTPSRSKISTVYAGAPSARGRGTGT